MRYLDPKNDLTFKKVFGEHPHLLKSFLNALLPIDFPIESLEYLPTELVPDIPVFKNSIVDVRCVDINGRQFIVEMQMLWTDSFKSRVLFNASKAFVRQIEKGNKYEGLQPVYSLCIVNEDFIPEMPQYLHHYKIVHIENSDSVIPGLEFVFIELPKFKANKFTDKKLSVLWLRYLSEIKDLQEGISEDFATSPEIEEATTLIKESAFTRGELETYDRYWDIISTEKTFKADSYIAGMREGTIAGIEQGIERGIEQGKVAEKTEGIKKALIRKKLSIEEIAEDFEVDIAFVINIQNNL
jgi:predicted transposase/invertase (TIGR01784 family)